MVVHTYDPRVQEGGRRDPGQSGVSSKSGSLFETLFPNRLTGYFLYCCDQMSTRKRFQGSV